MVLYQRLAHQTFYLFQRSKQRAQLLDADKFIWSQLRFLNECWKDHPWILCANQTSQNNKAKLSEGLCILGSDLQNAAQQFSLRQQCPNLFGLSENFWSAPHWAVQATVHFTKIYMSHSWWCWCCSFANVVLVGIFVKACFISVYFFWIQKYLGWRRSSRIGGCCCGPWAQKSGPALGWTTSKQQCANFCESFIAHWFSMQCRLVAFLSVLIASCWFAASGVPRTYCNSKWRWRFHFAVFGWVGTWIPECQSFHHLKKFFKRF